MNTKTLPGIAAIEYNLANDTALSPTRYIVPGDITLVVGNFVAFDLVNTASFNVSDEKTDAGVVYTTTITGTLFDNDLLNAKIRATLVNRYHVFRITDLYKKQYLVGIDRKPYPEITFSHVIDNLPDGIRAINFEITWNSDIPPIELQVL